MKKQVIITCLLVFFFFPGKAQYFRTGDDPGKLKWRQIQTPNFQLIYPEEIEFQAVKMASWLEKVVEYGSSTLKYQPRKISVILHTRTVQSNGLVGWAPRRMELFTQPHQAIYGQEWLEQLVIHEFRHVVQVDKINSQIPFLIRLLFGEQADALITGLYLPFWFIEGDAVATETALSQYGRGRLPSFLMEQKALLVEKGPFRFDKAINGSFREFVPDHYKLGYLLVGESRVRYGADLWNRVINQVARHPLSIRPVNRVLRQNIGMNQQKLYESITDSLKECWAREVKENPGDPFQPITRSSDDYHSYRYNHLLKSGEILSLKSDYQSPPRFVLTDQRGQETTVYYPGKIFEESVSYRNKLIVWSEMIPDVRWSHSGRSFIRILNLESHKVTTLKTEYKAFAPSISPDEHNVAVVETDFGNNSYLSLYNASSGELLTRYATPDTSYLFSPVWRSQEELVVVVLTEKGKQLASVKPKAGEIHFLPVPAMADIKQLTLSGDKLYFVGSISGKDEVYSIHLNSEEVKREAKARFGLAYPVIDEKQNRLIVSNYTSNGYKLTAVPLSDLKPDYICNVTNVIYNLADSLAKQEPGTVDFGKAEIYPYVSRPYHKGLNLFHFHSWGPFSLDVSSYDAMPGFTFSSQNKLGTSQTTLGYRWNLEELEGQYFVNMEYSGLFPVISGNVSLGERKDQYTQVTIYKDQNGREIRRESKLVPFSWGQTDLSASIRFPLDFSRGRNNTMIQPSLTTQWTNIRHNSSTPQEFVEGMSGSLTWRLGSYHLRRQAYRDLQPSLGLVTDFSYRHSPFGGSDPSTLASLEGKVYLPGLGRHHGLTTYAGWQQRERGRYRTSNDVRLPVGYQLNNLPDWWNQLENDKIFTASLKYAFPIGYPDWNLSKLLYIRRWKAAVYYDFSVIGGKDTGGNNTPAQSYQTRLNSFGLEISGDMNLLRFYAPVDAGVRLGYLPALEKMVYELILSVDFHSL